MSKGKRFTISLDLDQFNSSMHGKMKEISKRASLKMRDQLLRVGATTTDCMWGVCN